MISRGLYRISRGDVVRGLGKDWKDFPHSVMPAIEEAMRKVSGADLVYEKYGKIGDEYDLVYHIEPEGVTLHVELSTAVGRTLFGGDESKLMSVEKRVREAFGGI